MGRAVLEAGAFHEAFGDCTAILTAINDLDTRKKLLNATTTVRKRNFVESTAEEPSDGIRRLMPTHNAAAPRHAFNTFQFQIPETLPGNGGPGKLIDEVHSFGMLFSGCFYDLIAAIFADQTSKTEAKLLASAKTAGALLLEGARTAPITPRFFQSVGRSMVLADGRAAVRARRAYAASRARIPGQPPRRRDDRGGSPGDGRTVGGARRRDGSPAGVRVNRARGPRLRRIIAGPRADRVRRRRQPGG